APARVGARRAAALRAGGSRLHAVQPSVRWLADREVLPVSGLPGRLADGLARRAILRPREREDVPGTRTVPGGCPGARSRGGRAGDLVGPEPPAGDVRDRRAAATRAARRGAESRRDPAFRAGARRT